MTDTAAKGRTTARQGARPFRPAVLAGGTVLAAVVNLSAFWIATVAGAAMQVTTPGYQGISWPLVLVASIVPATAAGVVTWFVSRRRPGFRRWARGLGVGLALLSIVSPLFVASDPQTAIALAVMHLSVAAAWFIGLAPTRPRNA
ncbi:hypothetical protein C8K30_104121 [Promicromonospora sp. AC04]|uniref:DUF6069 family protein n=1 Tax=Promicromonospora sp. AC04 TaxID=2135723 RepID=UPI000D463545|nr:DUF6069 family protein [Promicromonospora sp. AC04]PUB27674.1 hypothetical protein C8K30_104121 [Promicromonospora sp. AC04]